jgi:hypothetical protein
MGRVRTRASDLKLSEGSNIFHAAEATAEYQGDANDIVAPRQ